MNAPNEVDIDGMMDRKGVIFIGSASKQPDGKYHCLANVNGCLCVVEVSITFCEEQ